MSLAVSLIIVSQKRPEELARAILSLTYQSLVNFEVIVVADAAPNLSTRLAQKMHFVECHEMNISKARNMGIEQASAPLIAFCDDDAIPDPYWLERLIKPFYDDETIAITTGFCRGRNGVSYQWKAVGFDRFGNDHAIEIAQSKPYHCYRAQDGRYVKAIGTNCAYRKAAVTKIGGFDEGFFYYLDDTDLCLRLQDQGWALAVVPNAEIIHSYYESRGRSSNRVPKTLYNIGASMHLFLRKHAADNRVDQLEHFYKAQEKRLEKFFHYGLVRGGQISRLLRDLRRGIDAGAARESKTPLRPTRNRKLNAMKTRSLALDIAFDNAPPLRAPDTIPIQVEIKPTNHGASMTFMHQGYWRLTGGRFGRLKRREPWWKYRPMSKARARVIAFLSPRFEN